MRMLCFVNMIYDEVAFCKYDIFFMFFIYKFLIYYVLKSRKTLFMLFGQKKITVMIFNKDFFFFFWFQYIPKYPILERSIADNPK